MDCVVLIPAYRPTRDLIDLASRLAASEAVAGLVIVNDGSPEECAEIFSAVAAIPGVTLLRHAVNLGKGAALKTGINHICSHRPKTEGIVTADADGQHLVEDIEAIARELAAQPDRLVLGVRRLEGSVPLRSRVGNTLTIAVFRLLVGVKIEDTQTGLRGIPTRFARNLLRLKTTGYEFELDMLLEARHQGVEIHQRPISTVYIDDNKASSFDPFWDSLKIYFVFFRFVLASLATTALALAVFFLVFLAGGGVIVSEASSRVASILLNFILVREVVFHSKRRVLPAFARYLVLVAILGIVTYALILGMVGTFGISVLTAKLASALILYLANFTIQRDFVFGLYDVAETPHRGRRR